MSSVRSTARRRTVEDQNVVADESVVRKTKTVEEVAEILGIGRSAAYAACARGQLPVVKVGRRILVPTAQLERLLRGE
jgi:excisionase family DNA binding protein